MREDIQTMGRPNLEAVDVSFMEHRSDSGIALIVVMSVLAMLIVIATPFLLQSRKDHASAVTVSERHRARQVANSALEWAKIGLLDTHQGVESQGRGKGTPYWDGPEEFRIDEHPKSLNDLIGVEGPRFMGDPKGDMWAIKVRDESGFINANTAPPFFWSSLVGRTVVTQEVEPNSGSIEVESTAGFPPTKGEIVVGGRVFSYRKAKGSSFTGVPIKSAIPQGAIVMTKMAWDLAMFGQKVKRAGYGLTELASITELKDVASYGNQALSEEKLSAILGPMTHVGFRENAGGWLAPQRITAELDPDSFEPESDGQPVRVSNPDFFNPGTVVKITDGQSTEYNIVRYSRRTGSGGVLSLLNQVSRGYAYETATISAEMRHPVNINNCSKRVLTLLLDGIDYAPRWRKHSNEEDRVSSSLAANVAEVLIKNRPIRGTEHLVDLLAALFHVKAGSFTEGESQITADMVAVPGFDNVSMTANHALGIVQNALNANHRSLINSTMPFSYVSHDYFTVETASSVNDGSGSELARFHMRETFRSAPSQELRHRLQSQADFEQSIVAGRAGKNIETYPNLMTFFTAETAKPEQRLFRYLHNFDDPSKIGFRPSRVEGDVRLQPARLYGGWTEHFDGNLSGPVARGLRTTKRTTARTEFIFPEGLPLNTGPYRLDMTVRGQTLGTGQKATAMADRNGLNPFVVEFFMKPASFSGGQALFSALGREPTADFIRAWYDSSQRVFRFQVHDIAFDDLRARVPSVAEVSWSPPQSSIEDDTWYHFSLHVTGTKPGEMSLHVDGFKRGKTRFQTKLASSLSESATSFTVEDASDWPDQGVFLVGTEVVNATRQGNNFTIFQNPNSGLLPLGRGARGSRVLSHSAGERVTLFGYSNVLRRTGVAGGEVLPIGGAGLAAELAPFSSLGIGDDGTMVETYTSPGAQGSPPMATSYEVLDLGTVNAIELAPLPTQNLNSAVRTFQTSGGYAIVAGLVYPSTPSASNVQPVNLQRACVLIRYSGRNGNRLTGVSLARQSFNADLVDGQFLMRSGSSTQAQGARDPKFYCSTPQKVITRDPSGGSTAPLLAQVFPISVRLTGNVGYKGPEVDQNGILFPEFIQLGTPNLAPDLRNFSNHAIEWVAYYGVDRTSSDFLCHDEVSLLNAVNILLDTAGLNVNTNTNLANASGFALPSILQAGAQLRWRGQAQTLQFGWTDINNSAHTHNAGSLAIPTFRVANVGGRAPGYGDAVSLLTAGNQNREIQFISWAADVLPPASWPSNRPVQLDTRACFTANVRSQLNQIALPAVSGSNLANGPAVWDRRRYTRIAKFPSGELPLITSQGDSQIGGDLVGGIRSSGMLDEIRVRAVQRNRYVLWDDNRADYLNSPPNPYPLGVSTNATEIPIVSALWVPARDPLNASIANFWLPDGQQLDTADPLIELGADAGLVMIDDEIIAFRSVAPGPGNAGQVLSDCLRGFMNTIPSEHSFGAPIVFLDFRATSKLLQSTSRESFRFQIADAQDFGVSDGNGRGGGTVLIGNEMIHFTSAAGNVLQMPRKIDRQSGETVGIFRARYGTRTQSHGSDDIVLDMPFRFWDRYVPQSDDPELSFYQFGVNEPRAFFKRISWHHRSEKSRLGMKVLLRFDPKVPWDTDPANSNGALLLLDANSGQGQDILSQHLLNRQARGLEARVFFVYEANAFDPVTLRSNDWKETPQLLDIELRYLAAPYVISRETLK